MKAVSWIVTSAVIAATGMFATGCTAQSPAPGPGCVANATLTPNARTSSLTNRAYVASRDSGNITVIDLDSLEIVASVDTCSPGYHMVELDADFTKAYASSPDKSRVDVLDARTLGVTGQISVGAEPTHMSLSRDGSRLAIVVEKDNAVSFVDPTRHVEIKRISGFYTPHFVRYAPDGRYAYVANLGAYHITRIDLQTLSIDGHIALDGFDGPPNATEVTEEVGFADAQIDANGVLWAAHGESGQVLVYDTKTQTKLPQQAAGVRPWIVYAEHPFAGIEARVVPNHGDRSVSLLSRIFATPLPSTTIVTGEPESYGVNYSPLAPEKAFVMNRLRREIAVVNTTTSTRDAIIDVGGNTETASTTADGRWIVAAVSSVNRVVIIDAKTNAIVKTFDHVGNYPWTVTIPRGQNYCH
jgi:DNA-binding beta-propeller fold protein YncE